MVYPSNKRQCMDGRVGVEDDFHVHRDEYGAYKMFPREAWWNGYSVNVVCNDGVSVRVRGRTHANCEGSVCYRRKVLLKDRSARKAASSSRGIVNIDRDKVEYQSHVN
jgi:hypothetical protein